MLAPESTLVKGAGTCRCDIRITLSGNGRWSVRTERCSRLVGETVRYRYGLSSSDRNALLPNTYQIACSTGGISERHVSHVSLAGAALFFCTLRDDMDELQTVAEAADELDVTPRTIRRRAAQGKIEARKLGGRWIISRDALIGQKDDEEIRERTPA